MLVTTSVTAIVRLTVISLEGTSYVTVKVKVSSTVVVSYLGRVVIVDVVEVLDKMAVVTWMGVV